MSDQQPLPLDGLQVITLLQRIRRRIPGTTEEMNFLIDVLSDGMVSVELDRAISEHWNGRRARKVSA